jgi:hypothetical protein
VTGVGSNLRLCGQPDGARNFWLPEDTAQEQRVPAKKAQTAAIGQYSDYLNISDMSDLLGFYCACGQRVKKLVGIASNPLCDGCAFRHQVMKAAGREQEFWDARPKPANIPGWVSYNVKYASDRPDATMRLRNIKAGTEDV